MVGLASDELPDIAFRLGHDQGSLQSDLSGALVTEPPLRLRLQQKDLEDAPRSSTGFRRLQKAREKLRCLEH